MNVRWRTVAEGSWERTAGRFTGQSHTEWFDPAGRRLGEEWRCWTIRTGGVNPGGRSGERTGANQLADRLMLLAWLVVLGGGLTLCALAR
ncbi:MAG: hypothetical protein ACM3XZ_04330 [Betaproteobacteria bacterium]